MCIVSALPYQPHANDTAITLTAITITQKYRDYHSNSAVYVGGDSVSDISDHVAMSRWPACGIYEHFYYYCALLLCIIIIVHYYNVS